MKTQEEREKFIKLRAQGLTFDKIAKRLKISKPTLINWSKTYAFEIANLRSERMEALREKFCLSVEAKVRMWGQIVNRIMDELTQRQFANLTTEKLISMLAKAQGKLEQSYIEPVFTSEDDIKDYMLQTLIAQVLPRSLDSILLDQAFPTDLNDLLQKHNILDSSDQNFTKSLPEFNQIQNSKTPPEHKKSKKGE